MISLDGNCPCRARVVTVCDWRDLDYCCLWGRKDDLLSDNLFDNSRLDVHLQSAGLINCKRSRSWWRSNNCLFYYRSNWDLVNCRLLIECRGSSVFSLDHSLLVDLLHNPRRLGYRINMGHSLSNDLINLACIGILRRRLKSSSVHHHLALVGYRIDLKIMSRLQASKHSCIRSSVHVHLLLIC